MIGARTPLFRKSFTASRPSMSGRPTSMMIEVDVALARRLQPARRGLGMDQLELVVEGKLVDQGLAQIGVVVDDEDLAGCHGGLAGSLASKIRLERRRVPHLAAHPRKEGHASA